MNRPPFKAPPLPGKVISRLMGFIRQKFVPDYSGEAWGKWFTFIKREVVTFPAAFMEEKGFALTIERYEKVMISVLSDVLSNVKEDPKCWPAYLKVSVQSHFRHQWERYYEEAKSARRLADVALLGLGKVKDASSERRTEVLAELHHAMKAAKKEKARKPVGNQLDLF